MSDLTQEQISHLDALRAHMLDTFELTGEEFPELEAMAEQVRELCEIDEHEPPRIDDEVCMWRRVNCQICNDRPAASVSIPLCRACRGTAEVEAEQRAWVKRATAEGLL